MNYNTARGFAIALTLTLLPGVVLTKMHKQLATAKDKCEVNIKLGPDGKLRLTNVPGSCIKAPTGQTPPQS